jgi:hypothetical protein
MKKVVYILVIIVFLTAIYSCKKNDDPLAEYAQYGVLREAYPLKDTISVNLRKGDSTAIETNLGKMWLKISDLYVSCYKGKNDGTCPDIPISLNCNLRLEKYKDSGIVIYLGIQAFPRENENDRFIFNPCDFKGLSFDVLGVLGSMNIQMRTIYPNPASKAEYDKLVANNGFRTIVTFQKRCL